MFQKDILDNMGGEGIESQPFRITHTESKLKIKNVYSEKDDIKTHYNIIKNVREVIAKNGRTMSE